MHRILAIATSGTAAKMFIQAESIYQDVNNMRGIAVTDISRTLIWTRSLNVWRRVRLKLQVSEQRAVRSRYQQERTL